jgi:hypothetical protein
VPQPTAPPAACPYCAAGTGYYRVIARNSRHKAWYRQFFSVILACRLGFEPQSFHVGFVVDTVRESHIILQVFGFPPIINIPPMSHARPSWYSSQKDKWAKPGNLLTGRCYLRKN